MPQAQLTITLHEGVWVAQISREFPKAVFRVLAAIPGESSGYALIRLTHEDIPAILAGMEEHPQLLNVHVMHVSDGDATVQFETTAPLLLFCSQASGIPMLLPVIIQDGRAQVSVNGPSERLSELGERLHEKGLEFEVDHVRTYTGGTDILSDRQREVLDVALKNGYYDNPRQCTLTELADILGIAKSSCSELFQRAESTVIKHYIRELQQDGSIETSSPVSIQL